MAEGKGKEIMNLREKEGKMENKDEEEMMLYLYFWNRLVAIDMNKKFLVNGGGCGAGVPDLTPTPLRPDRLVVFSEQNLSVGMGFYVDGSKIYVAGGESVDGRTTSRTMYVADISDMEFSQIHQFEAIKPPSPLVVKIKGRFYAMTTRNYRRCPSRSYLEEYVPESTKTRTRTRTRTRRGAVLQLFKAKYFTRRTKTRGSSDKGTRTRRLPVPPFFKPRSFTEAWRSRGEPTGYAVVGNTLCVETVDEHHFFNVVERKWMTSPTNRCELLQFLHSNSMIHHLCHGSFVLGCDDVLFSIIDGRLGTLQALLLPPIRSGGENEVPVIFCQPFPGVDNDLLAISRHHDGGMCCGMILSFDGDKMCAIFQCIQDDPFEDDKYIVYIYIFQVSKLSEQPVADHLPSSSGPMLIYKDFISVTPLHKGLYYLDRQPEELPLLSGAFITRGSKAVCYRHHIF